MQYITGTGSPLGSNIIDETEHEEDFASQRNLDDEEEAHRGQAKLSISELNAGNNVVILLSEQSYRLAIYCMSLWFWMTSGITYFGIIIADDHDLPHTIKVLFYLSLCAISLMIMGVIATSLKSDQMKCIKYASGAMWLLSGLLMIAVVLWEFHINYNDAAWKAQHAIHNYAPSLYFMATFANYLPVIAITFIIAAEIMFDYGGRHVFLNIMLFALVIFISCNLWALPLFRQYQSQNSTIIFIMKLSYVMIGICSLIILIVFVLIHKFQKLYCVKFVVIICVFVLSVFGCMTQTYYSDGDQFTIFAQEPSGHLHSNFVWLLYITLCGYMVLNVSSTVFVPDISQKRGLIMHESINDDAFLRFSMNVDVHALQLNLEHDAQSNDSKKPQRHRKAKHVNMLNDDKHRIGLYCLCLWYWIIPDLCGVMMMPQDSLSSSGKLAANLMIAAFIVDIISICAALLHLMCDTKRCVWMISVLFVCGGLLMCASRAMTIRDDCTHESMENTYCGIAQISTYLIGVLLPIYIGCDLLFKFAALPRILCSVFIMLTIAALWSVVIFRYDVDVNIPDILFHAKFRKDMQSVVRMAWILLMVSVVSMAILVVIEAFKHKALWLTVTKRIAVVLFLIACGMCVISHYGGQIDTNLQTEYPLWTAAFPTNSYWTLFLFSIIIAYDVVNAS